MRTLATLFLVCAAPCLGAEPRVVPLGEIVTNTGQPGMRYKELELLELTERERLLAGDRSLGFEKPSGASQVFLVEGVDFLASLRASAFGIAASARGDEPICPTLTADQHWCVAYLGAGSSTPTIAVESVTVSDGEVVVAYRKLHSRLISCDVSTRWYWAPLGRLPEGLYEVKLFDLDKQRPTLVRYVEVLDPPKNLQKKQPQIRADERK
jgi:hypothetical protein